MSSTALEPTLPDAMLRLLEAMGFSAVRVTSEVVALTTKATAQAA